MKILRNPVVLFPALVLVFCGCNTNKDEPVGKRMPAGASEPIARTEPVDKQEQSIDHVATIASLKTAYKKAHDEYRTASASAESAEEKQKLKRPSVEDYSTDMMAAVEHDVESPEAFDGLLWLYDKTKRKDKQTAENYLALMMKHHYARERLAVSQTGLPTLINRRRQNNTF